MITPYPKTFSGQIAVQEQGEFENFLNFIREKQIESYLEVGVGRGDSFHEIVSQMPLGSRALAIDLPEQAWGLNDSQIMLQHAVIDLNREGYRTEFIFADSKWPEVIRDVEAAAPFDLVFIDGDHTYDGVKSDFENYGKLGKYVAFHDIVDSMEPNLVNEVIEVPLFWQELKQKYRYEEFIVEGSNMGIGLIYNG